MTERTIPEVGQKAPMFTLKDADGAKHALRDQLGSRVVVYFYPKDDTPGCTVEACDFRDRMEQLVAADAVVFGVSPDSAESHAKFVAKFDLNFALLSDPDRAVMTKYGAWGEKVLYGKKKVGVIRSTFIIDRKGKIARVWKSVRTKGHVDKVLEALAEVG